MLSKPARAELAVRGLYKQLTTTRDTTELGCLDFTSADAS